MKKYKIDPNRISEFTTRHDSRLLNTLSLIMGGMAFLMFIINKQNGTSNGIIWKSVVLILLTGLIVGLIYFNNKKLTRICADNLLVSIDENSINSSIDLENDSRMNFLHKYAYQEKRNLSGYNSKIYFTDLESMENKKGDLYLKSAKTISLLGNDFLLVPQELIGIEEIEHLIRSKLS